MVRTRLLLAFSGLLLLSSAATAQTVNLAWDASTDPNVTGYTIKWGTHPQNYTTSVNVGNVTTWTVTGLVPDQKYYFVVTSYAASGLSSGPSNEVSNDALVVSNTGGALYDQKPALFWHNKVTGQLETWLVTGTNVIDTRPISMGGVADVNWQVAGIGDLNGDGHADILWRHMTQGWLAVWFLQFNQVIGTTYLSINKMLDPNWKIRALGDLDGDKCADIVWQHTNGGLAAWLMKGATVSSTRFLSIPSVGAIGWNIAAVADTNGDGLGDIIWQDTATGWLAVWYMSGTTVMNTLFLSIPKMPDTNWRIVTAGNIDGSGKVSIVWRHIVDGWVAKWDVAGTQVLGTFFFNPNNVYDQNWRIVGSR